MSPKRNHHDSFPSSSCLVIEQKRRYDTTRMTPNMNPPLLRLDCRLWPKVKSGRGQALAGPVKPGHAKAARPARQGRPDLVKPPKPGRVGQGRSGRAEIGLGQLCKARRAGSSWVGLVKPCTGQPESMFHPELCRIRTSKHALPGWFTSALAPAPQPKMTSNFWPILVVVGVWGGKSPLKTPTTKTSPEKSPLKNRKNRPRLCQVVGVW